MASAGKRNKKSVSIKAPPWAGDHGTGTKAAMAGTVVLPLEGDNPNRFARRQRIGQVDALKERLSQRQWQAAKAIEDAYCRVQMLSSGAPLKEQVDSSPRPDATVSTQTDAQSRLNFVMSKVPAEARDVVEHVCWYNRPMSTMTKGRKHYNRMADFKVALDLVANHMRF